MRMLETDTAKRIQFGAALTLALGLGTTGRVHAADDLNFSNPGVSMAADAVIASGACIAKYASTLDDRSKPASEIGRRVANRCANLISRSAGMAALVSGKSYDDNLRYMRDDLTTNTVIRLRAALQRTSAAASGQPSAGSRAL